MEHRRFLAHPEAHRPFVGSDLLARIGGPATVGMLVDGLYDRIESDAALRCLFWPGSDRRAPGTEAFLRRVARRREPV
jgi:truncated hemoglobin YjbI